MLFSCIRFVLCASPVLFFGCYVFCDGHTFKNSPLPFPPCRADDIDCLRRGFRTFFFLMDSGHMGMKSIDPALINSMVVSLPEQQLTFLLRNLNVTGARWTKLAERKLFLPNGKSGVKFTSDLHVSGEIIMTIGSENIEPISAWITMDMQDVETNITYKWTAMRDIAYEDYIIIGQERIAVRNVRTPTYFLQSDDVNAKSLDETLQMKSSVLDNISNEIVVSLMRNVIDNFRLFASTIPVKHYYRYY